MPVCRWPNKIPHATQRDAQAHLNGLRRSGDRSVVDMVAYPCGDHWHIGHDARRFSKRIRRALASGTNRTTIYRRRT